MISHMSYVRCDRCGSPGPEGDDAKEARQEATLRRWKVRPQYAYDLCPPCAYGMIFNEVSGMFQETSRPRALANWRGE